MKISIITPTYNRKDLLPETIESVKRSILIPFSELEWEYIIYDDGSTDGTPDLFKDFSHPNIRYVRNDRNQGQSQARNDAVSVATGDYLFFLDSDDILLQRTLYKLACKAEESPDVGWFIADFLHVDSDLRYLGEKDYYAWDFNDVSDMLSSIFKGEHYIQQNIFVKRSLFIEAGMFDPSVKMGEDLDLCVRLLLKGHMPQRCDLISHLHRVHVSNMSAGISKEMHEKSALELQEKYAHLTGLI